MAPVQNDPACPLPPLAGPPTWEYIFPAPQPLLMKRVKFPALSLGPLLCLSLSPAPSGSHPHFPRDQLPPNFVQHHLPAPLCPVLAGPARLPCLCSCCSFCLESPSRTYSHCTSSCPPLQALLECHLISETLPLHHPQHSSHPVGNLSFHPRPQHIPGAPRGLGPSDSFLCPVTQQEA